MTGFALFIFMVVIFNDSLLRKVKVIHTKAKAGIFRRNKTIINREDAEKERKLLYRHKGKIKSVEKQGWKTTALKKIGSFPQKIGRFKMNAYPYLQPEHRSDIERRKSRVQAGIIFEQIDRRQVDTTPYTDSERRSGMDRRSLIWDRRKAKVPCYS